MRMKLHRLGHETTTTLRSFQGYLRLMEDKQGFRKLEDPDGQAFLSLGDFATCKRPFGLGYDPHVVEAIETETREMLLGDKVQELREQAARTVALMDTPGNPTGNNQYSAADERNCDNITIPHVTRGSTGQAYLLARIKRDRPDIFARVEAGEFPSARAAARAAGIVRDPTPLARLHKAWEKASAAERAQFLLEVREKTGVGNREAGIGEEGDASSCPHDSPLPTPDSRFIPEVHHG
jgi:hypothetical protein